MTANESQRRLTVGKTQVNEGPQRPTTANDGQRRPTQVNEGPQRPTTANDGQRRSTKAHSGQRRPTQANAGRGTRFSLSNVCFFSRFVPLKLTILYKLYLAQRRPTQANVGQRRPTAANDG